ncbi:MAG: biotin/lipoyl-binding protein, partial [Sedimentisphaerales bacterium]|nr:biotin/lipoyl-binding protein [Sedimentisphaerales bacterium]
MKLKYLFLLIIPAIAACNTGDGESDAYGNFEAVETYVSPEMSGKVLRVYFDEGQLLEAGALLARIDTVPLV